MNQVLRIRRPLQHREPAAGFASCLAAVNRRSMDEFLRDMGIPPRSIDKGEPEMVAELARIGGADPDELLRYTPRPGPRDRTSIVAGESLGHLAVNRTYFRFCPACIAEDLATFPGIVVARPWLRLQWTVTYFRSCDRHGIFLSTAAPLRRRFKAFDFVPAIEPHLDDVADLVNGSEAAPPSPFQDWVLRRLDGRRDPGFWLDGTALHVGAEWCEALGISALHPSRVRTSTLTQSDTARAADEGFQITAGGKESILAFLAGLNDAQRRTRGFWGLRDTYGHAYGLLQKTVEDPEYENLRVLVRDFAHATVPIAPGTDVLGVVIDKPAVVSVRSAARATGAHDRTIRRMIERQGVARDAIDDGLRNHRVTVMTSEVAHVLSRLRGALTAPRVVDRYGIPRLHLRALVGVGALPTVTGTENAAYAKHRFASGDVDEMLRRLFHGATDVHDPGPRQLSVMDTRHAAGTSLGQLLTMIFDGKLRWKGRLAGRTDYGALLLDADEVTALVRREPPMAGILRQDIAEAIPGMNRFALNYFVGNGLLEVKMEFSPDARREVPVVTRSSAAAFLRRYVTLGELTQTSGLHHKRVRLLLRGVPIEPVYTPENAKIYVYDRLAIDNVVARKPSFWRYDKAVAVAAVGR